jgi:hypothetical protein
MLEHIYVLYNTPSVLAKFTQLLHFNVEVNVENQNVKTLKKL